MTVIVEGKNYTVISACESDADGGTWTSATEDGDQRKEGTYSLSATLKNAGLQGVTFTPTVPVDLFNKHLRVWFIGTQGGKLAPGSGIRLSMSDGIDTHYWYMGGRDTYAGGWINLAVDTTRAADDGVTIPEPTGISVIGIHVYNESSTKNAVNTWWDNLTVGDGLVAFDVDGDGGFDIDDIFNYENDPTIGGFGIIRKIGGAYFLNGSLTIGDTSTSGATFSDTSKIMIYENRPVATGLYKLAITGNATNSTDAIFGSKVAGKGVAGCVIQSESPSLPFSIYGDGAYVNTAQFLGCNFIDADFTYLSGYSSGLVEALSTSWQQSNEVIAKDTLVQYCSFINADDRGLRMIVTGHNISDGTFINCPTGLHITGVEGTYEASITDMNFFNCDADIENSIVSGIVTGNSVDSNASNSKFIHTQAGTGSIVAAVTLTVNVVTQLAVPISGARVRMFRQTDDSLIYQSYTSPGGVSTTSYNYGGDEDIWVRIRKSVDGETKYYPIVTPGEIDNKGFTLTYSLTEDPYA